MRRRDFIAAIGGAIAAPITAHAQHSAVPVIGYLYGGWSEPNRHLVAIFHEGLSENGYLVGKNVAIEYRWAEGQYDRLREMATDLVRRQVALIVAPGGAAPALAARAATETIAIVFTMGGDPVKLGLVAGLASPGGNATGINFFSIALGEKQLGLLLELVPQANRIAVLVNPGNPLAHATALEVRTAALKIGKDVILQSANSRSAIDDAFVALKKTRPDALIVIADTVFNNQRAQLAERTSHLGIPAIYPAREFSAAGGLMSYGTSLKDAYRQLGIYAGLILKGAKPSDLPVLQPTRFELVINLKTVKALGIEVPPTLLARADEVIE